MVLAQLGFSTQQRGGMVGVLALLGIGPQQQGGVGGGTGPTGGWAPTAGLWSLVCAGALEQPPPSSAGSPSKPAPHVADVSSLVQFRAKVPV